MVGRDLEFGREHTGSGSIFADPWRKPRSRYHHLRPAHLPAWAPGSRLVASSPVYPGGDQHLLLPPGGAIKRDFFQRHDRADGWINHSARCCTALAWARDPGARAQYLGTWTCEQLRPPDWHHRWLDCLSLVVSRPVTGTCTGRQRPVC